jgi:hypothetical protein
MLFDVKPPFFLQLFHCSDHRFYPQARHVGDLLAGVGYVKISFPFFWSELSRRYLSSVIIT